MLFGKDEVIKIDSTDENGNSVTYDVVMMYDSDVTGKRYCFYTDGTKNSQGSLNIRVGSVGQLADKIVMEDITNPIEREMISRDYERFINGK